MILSDSNINSLINRVNNKLNIIDLWLRKNKLSLNYFKTLYVLLCVLVNKPSIYLSIFYLFLFYLYIYPPDSQESDGGANTKGKQLSRPASGDTKIFLSACNLIEIGL